MRLFHPSLELGQHGGKGLLGAIEFCQRAGCTGAQPSNYLLQDDNGLFMPASTIKEVFASRGLTIDGISTHCMWWVHGTAHTGSPTIRPFLPKELHFESIVKIEAWAENYLRNAMDLSVELGCMVMPMFLGVYQGWELASGYPWGFGRGPGYDLYKEADERFLTKTQRLRAHARSLGLKLAHEIHPNSGAICADDFLHLVKISDHDPVLGVFADPSHCWEGESFEDRFTKVGPYIWGAHVKDFKTVPGRSLRSQTGDWRKRGMHFTLLGAGNVDLQRYVEILIDSGLPERWRALHGRTEATLPLCAEAESAHVSLDDAARHGVQYVRDNLCREVAGVGESFEDGMGAS